MLFLPLLAYVVGPASASAIGNLSQASPNDDPINTDFHSPFSVRAIRGVRKMSDDEGEKFFPEYWHYEDGEQQEEKVLGMAIEGNPHSTTREASNILPRTYPLRQASYQYSSPLQPRRRSFTCPAGTFSCASIDRPSSCCSTGETCELVKDTGSGDVGCCPQGQTCSGTVGSCRSGYSACSADLGGGCCIPGYECVRGGCASVYTVTVTVLSTVMVSTSTHFVAPTDTETTSTSTSSKTATTSSTSTSTSTASDLAPPARPTSLSTATTSTSQHSSTTSTNTDDICPTGFYACIAQYQGGCCRTGRDCDTTSCPTTASSTITDNGRTIVVPVETTAPTAGTGGGGSGSGSGRGRCANGWFSCADTVGGGCCPTGYACGSSCTAVATGTATGRVAKGQPTVVSGGVRERVRMFVVVVGVVVVPLIIRSMLNA